MSLKEAIERQFEENTDYSRPRQAVNQANSLNTLSRDLYTDAKRFVYELLQNADDAADGKPVKVAIRLFNTSLVIAHTGNPFSERDLRGLCGINDGTKKNAVEKTGYKGIGFKAVFGQSQKVTVFTAKEYFRFDAQYTFGWKAEWEEDQASWEQENDRKFEFPWQIIPISTNIDEVDQDIHTFLSVGNWNVATIVDLERVDDTVRAIKELSTNLNMFLFLKNIYEIDFNLGESIIVQLDRSEKGEEITLKLNGKNQINWILKSITLSVPPDLKQKIEHDQNIPDKLKSANQTELIFAAKKTTDGIIELTNNEKLLYSYLPTEEQRYSFPVLVNASFLTTANRESLHVDSVWNQWLFKNIGSELFKWIGELVTGEMQYQAYRLLPKRSTIVDDLAKSFNLGFEEAIKSTPFIISKTGTLLKVDEAIIDFTFLSSKDFIGKDVVRNFIAKRNGTNVLNQEPFLPYTGYESKLKDIGVTCFEWIDMPRLLESIELQRNHSIDSNKLLINHIKGLCETEKPREVTSNSIKKWNLIFDHRNQLKSPEEIFFPDPDDDTWNRADNELSFLNLEIQSWLMIKPEIRAWLESLGVVEKSDLSYLQKTIIPNAENHITLSNAVQTVQTLFSQYLKNELNGELEQLGKLKLLTQKGTLLSASQCYLSDFYQPRLEIESILDMDIFMSEKYFIDETEVDEWKRFFKLMEVKEGIDILQNKNKVSVKYLETNGFESGYFEMEDKKFWDSYFTANHYSSIFSLSYVSLTNSLEFSKLFWRDIIQNQNPVELKHRSTAYWGYSSNSGQTSGNKVKNYIEWFIDNKSCIPTSTKMCYPANQVFINDKEIKELAGEYLPVFEGAELLPDWRSLFQFKTKLKLPDYLKLLSQISLDVNNSDKIKNDNRKRVDTIFEYLLNSCPNWSEENQQEVKEWSVNNVLIGKDERFHVCSELKHYADGNSNIFQGAYPFIALNNANQRHSEIENLLQLLGVEIFSQSQFKINTVEEKPAIELTIKLTEILPYWAKWMEKEVQGGFEQMIYELESKLDQLQVYFTRKLSITYGANFEKPVSAHLNGSSLYVLKNWETATVMFDLPDKLLTFFDVKGYRKEFVFLLEAELTEIQEHFEKEGMELPLLNDTKVDSEVSGEIGIGKETENIEQRIDYDSLRKNNRERNEELFAKTLGEPKDNLLYGLEQQESVFKGSVYHFTHIENAIQIIKSKTIKSRQSASFKDSAGGGIIAQTDDAKKEFARFYFRPQTPTQFYIENWGRGKESIEKLGDEPICPIPIFFKIPLVEVLPISDWKISLGNMAVANMLYGNEMDIIKQFDFEGVYKSKEDIEHNRFMAAAHQEFLIQDKLDLNAINYELIVQDENAKNSLLALLDDNEEWECRIIIDSSFYHNNNPQININQSKNKLSIQYGTSRSGEMILQVEGAGKWNCLSGDDTFKQYQLGQTTIVHSTNIIDLEGDLDLIKFSFYYYYNGQQWLIHTNTSNSKFKTEYIQEFITEWLETETGIPENIINVLCIHPELKHWFSQKIGGPDRLNLLQHTSAVIKNYVKCFDGQQQLFENEKYFLLFLALHDIGKPMAILNGNKEEQHKFSIKIIGQIKDVLDLDNGVIERIVHLLDGDPIGKYLNQIDSQTKEEAIEQINKMAMSMGLTINELWPTLLIYYQCDAAGYDSLQKSIYINNAEGEIVFDSTLKRLSFIESIETKFKELENEILACVLR